MKVFIKFSSTTNKKRAKDSKISGNRVIETEKMDEDFMYATMTYLTASLNMERTSIDFAIKLDD